MNLLEINAQLQTIETNQELLHWKIGAWSAWPIIRFNLAVLASKLVIDTTDIRLTAIEYIQQSTRDITGFLRSKNPKVLLYVASSNRVEQESGLYKDIIFDELLHYIPEYFKIENINNKYYLNQSQCALYPSQISTSCISLITNILSKLVWPHSIDIVAREFFNTIQKNWRISEISYSYICRVLRTYYWRKRLFHNLLYHLKPQVLFLQVAYTNHALVAAAKELNIKAIEFQHGIIDRHHPGYSWQAPAICYKNQMPIPDLIFVYGDYWADELTFNGFWNKEIRSVGSLRLDEYRFRHDSVTINNNNRIFLSKKITVTTQALDIDRLISFLIEFIKNSTIPIEVDIKLHPREFNRQPYENAFKTYPNVRIISGHEFPSTFELLSITDFHVSIHSTCHYEALGLGKPTIILPFTNHERMLPLCAQVPGFAFLARTPTEMNQIITQNITVPPQIASYYFRERTLENMMKVIRQEVGDLIINCSLAGDQ